MRPDPVMSATYSANGTRGSAEGFTIVGRQKAHHDSGYVVEIVDRHTVRYIDEDKRATIEVEFGPTTAVHADSLALTHQLPGRSTSAAELVTTRDRITQGLEALGLSCELVYLNR